MKGELDPTMAQSDHDDECFAAKPLPMLSSRRQIIEAGAWTGAIAALGFPIAAMSAEVSFEPFRVAVPQAAIDDLRHRLAAARCPERQTVNDWSQGVPLKRLQRLVDYWRRGYDWRRFEARINALPQYRTRIDGLGMHFLHVRSKHADALPIILTHGWPGSVVEFLKVIAPMTDPTAHGGSARDAFHVVIPSLPGFGFSEKPAAPGWNSGRIAAAWAVLMQRLGYTRWVAQGGDFGASVTNTLALHRAPGLQAIHLTIPIAIPATLPERGADAEEQAAIDTLKHKSADMGYFQEQATRPQTIGYALDDSPVGLAAWIYEKFQAWTDNDGEPERALSDDEMLDDISLYWFTKTAASAARLYWEDKGKFGGNQGVVDFPVGVSVFPKEIVKVPRRWADKVYPQIIYWNEPRKGGHFAAFEQPTLFVEEMRACFRQVRGSRA